MKLKLSYLLFTFALTALARPTLTIDCLATGNDSGVEAEFLLIGSESDRAYESLFTLVPGITTSLWQRVQALNLPKGSSCDAMDLRFWPKGEHFSVRIFEMSPARREVPFSELITDRQREELRVMLVASNLWDASEMPCSIISLYNDSQTIFDLPYRASKATTYGRFKFARKLKRGNPYQLELTWLPATNNLPRANDYTLHLTAKMPLADVVSTLKREVETGRDCYLKIAPEDDVPALRLQELATLLKPLELPTGVRIDKPAPDQFYILAFLPRAEWRTPSARPFQPWELHIGATNRFVRIEEDWNVEGLEPKLIPHSYSLQSPDDAGRIADQIDNPEKPMHTLLVFCEPTTTAGELRRWIEPLRRKRPLPFIWFFIDQKSKEPLP